MHCIVGLGNPEPRYSLTRHNIGFQIADKLAQSHGTAFHKGKGEYLAAKGSISGSGVLIVKPTTYMNRSGIALQQVVQFYRVPIENILIVLDDLDLSFGTFRLRPHGSDAGNRGLKSIIHEAGTDEIARFRFGIRNRDKIANSSSYVLSNFNRKERTQLPCLLSLAEDALEAWVSEGINRTMNRFNRHHLD